MAAKKKNLKILSCHFQKRQSLNFSVFSPDSTKVATGYDFYSAVILEVQTGLVLHTLRGHVQILSAAFSPDGNRLIMALADDTAKIWDVQTGQALRVLNGHQTSVRFAAFSPDGTKAITSSKNSITKVWNLETDGVVTLLGQIQNSVPSPFSPDSNRIITVAGDGIARIWDMETGVIQNTLGNHRGRIGSAKFSPNGKKILTTGNLQLFNEQISNQFLVPTDLPTEREVEPQIWDAETGTLLQTLEGHSGHVKIASFSKDSTHVITGSNDGTVRIWDSETGLTLRTLNGDGSAIQSANVFSGFQKVIAVTSLGSLFIWDLETSAVIHAERTTSTITPTSISGDGKTVLVSRHYLAIKLWNLKGIFRKFRARRAQSSIEL